MARLVAKFRVVTLFSAKVIDAFTLNFKPILTPALKKILSGIHVPGGGCASETWSFSSACKNLGAQHPLGAEIMSPKQSI